MTIDSLPSEQIHQDKVIKLTKELLLNNLQTATAEEKESIWLRKKEEVLQGRQYCILEGNKFASYCKISDIDFDGGNLVVYTADGHRNKGYGKAVVTEAVRWCLDHHIIPVYWVDQNNLPSISLAKSLGFQVMSEEIVVGTCKETIINS